MPAAAYSTTTCINHTQILVNPTQLSDVEFTAWMDRLVEARRNTQENKPRPYRQFRKQFSQNRREKGDTTQDRLKISSSQQKN